MRCQKVEINAGLHSMSSQCACLTSSLCGARKAVFCLNDQTTSPKSGFRADTHTPSAHTPKHKQRTTQKKTKNWSACVCDLDNFPLPASSSKLANSPRLCNRGTLLIEIGLFKVNPFARWYWLVVSRFGLRFGLGVAQAYQQPMVREGYAGRAKSPKRTRRLTRTRTRTRTRTSHLDSQGRNQICRVQLMSLEWVGFRVATPMASP